MFEILNSKKLNTKQLTLEQAEQDQPFFDPERDIPASDRKAMFATLDSFRVLPKDTTEGDKFLEMAKFLKVLFPKRTERFALDETVERTMEYFLDLYMAHFESHHAEHAFEARVLSPEIFSYYTYGEEGWKSISQKMTNTEISIDFAANAVALLSLYPERKNKLPIIDTQYEWLVSIYNDLYRKNRIVADRFTEYPADLKILFPDRFDVDEDLLTAIKADLQTLRREGLWRNYAFEAYHLYLMSSERVEIRKDGVSVIPKVQKKPFQEETLLPRERNF